MPQQQKSDDILYHMIVRSVRIKANPCKRLWHASCYFFLKLMLTCVPTAISVDFDVSTKKNMPRDMTNIHIGELPR